MATSVLEEWLERSFTCDENELDTSILGGKGGENDVEAHKLHKQRTFNDTQKPKAKTSEKSKSPDEQTDGKSRLSNQDSNMSRSGNSIGEHGDLSRFKRSDQYDLVYGKLETSLFARAFHFSPEYLHLVTNALLESSHSTHAKKHECNKSPMPLSQNWLHVNSNSTEVDSGHSRLITALPSIEQDQQRDIERDNEAGQDLNASISNIDARFDYDDVDAMLPSAGLNHELPLLLRCRAYWSSERTKIVLYSLFWLGAIAFGLFYGLTFFYSPYFAVLGYWIVFAKTAAGVMYWCMAVVFLPVCYGVIAALQTTRTARQLLPLGKAQQFHITCASAFVSASIVHSICHLAGTFRILQNFPCPASGDKPPFCGKPYFQLLLATIPGLTGVLLLILFILMVITSTQKFRTNNFPTFYRTHQSYFLVVVLLCIHGTGGWVQAPHAWRYVAFSFLLYLLDRGFRMIQTLKLRQFRIIRARMVWSNPEFADRMFRTTLEIAAKERLTMLKYFQKCDSDVSNPPETSQEGRDLASLRSSLDEVLCPENLLNGGECFLVLELARPQPMDKFTFKAGQYALVQFPALSRQWHPFTISSSPTDPSVVRFHIKVIGWWTQSLRKLIITESVKKLVHGCLPKTMTPKTTRNGKSCEHELPDPKEVAGALTRNAFLSFSQGTYPGSETGHISQQWFPLCESVVHELGDAAVTPMTTHFATSNNGSELEILVNGPLGAPTVSLQSAIKGDELFWTELSRQELPHNLHPGDVLGQQRFRISGTTAPLPLPSTRASKSAVIEAQHVQVALRRLSLLNANPPPECVSVEESGGLDSLNDEKGYEDNNTEDGANIDDHLPGEEKQSVPFIAPFAPPPEIVKTTKRSDPHSEKTTKANPSSPSLNSSSEISSSVHSGANSSIPSVQLTNNCSEPIMGTNPTDEQELESMGSKMRSASDLQMNAPAAPPHVISQRFNFNGDRVSCQASNVNKFASSSQVMVAAGIGITPFISALEYTAMALHLPRAPTKFEPKTVLKGLVRERQQPGIMNQKPRVETASTPMDMDMKTQRAKGSMLEVSVRAEQLGKPERGSLATPINATVRMPSHFVPGPHPTIHQRVNSGKLVDITPSKRDLSIAPENSPSLLFSKRIRRKLSVHGILSPNWNAISPKLHPGLALLGWQKNYYASILKQNAISATQPLSRYDTRYSPSRSVFSTSPLFNGWATPMNAAGRTLRKAAAKAIRNVNIVRRELQNYPPVGEECIDEFDKEDPLTPSRDTNDAIHILQRLKRLKTMSRSPFFQSGIGEHSAVSPIIDVIATPKNLSIVLRSSPNLLASGKPTQSAAFPQKSQGILGTSIKSKRRSKRDVSSFSQKQIARNKKGVKISSKKRRQRILNTPSLLRLLSMFHKQLHNPVESEQMMPSEYAAYSDGANPFLPAYSDDKSLMITKRQDSHEETYKIIEDQKIEFENSSSTRSYFRYGSSGEESLGRASDFANSSKLTRTLGTQISMSTSPSIPLGFGCRSSLDLVWAVREVSHLTMFHAVLNHLVVFSSLTQPKPQLPLAGIRSHKRSFQDQFLSHWLNPLADVRFNFRTTVFVTSKDLIKLAEDPRPVMRAIKQIEKQQLPDLNGTQTANTDVSTTSYETTSASGPLTAQNILTSACAAFPYAADQASIMLLHGQYLLSEQRKNHGISTPSASHWTPCSVSSSQHANATKPKVYHGSWGTWIFEFGRPDHHFFQQLMVPPRGTTLKSLITTPHDPYNDPQASVTCVVGKVTSRHDPIRVGTNTDSNIQEVDNIRSVSTYCCCPRELSKAVYIAGREVMRKEEGLRVLYSKECF